MQTLRDNVLACDYDILMFSEPWLSDEIASAVLDFNDFVIFRCDRYRLNSHTALDGGEVLIAFRSTFSVREMPNPDTSLEQVWVSITSENQVILFGCIYLPPTTHVSAYEIFGNSLLKLHEEYQTPHFFIAGDFNLPHFS